MALSQLTPDRAYFFCGYYSDTSNVPSIETYIYLGTVSEVLGGPPREKREHIFQDAESYFQQQRGELSSTASPEERGLVLIAEDVMEPMVKDYEGLLTFLERCKSDVA
jgi:hypothetical protein